MTVLLLDDERDFLDGRVTLVARSTDEAVELTEAIDELDELWLDYVLKGWDSTDQFLATLVKRKRAGRPLRLKKVFIHTSSFSAVSLLNDYLAELEVSGEDIERVDHKAYFKG